MIDGNLKRLTEQMKFQRLADVATFINGRAFKPEDWKTEGLPIIRIQNLTGSSNVFNYYDGVVEEKYIVRKGDLLISWSASLGVYEWDDEDGVLNQHIFKVVLNKGIEKKYFYYAIYTRLEEMESQVHGSTMKHITKGKFDDIKIPVPDLQTQKQIAQILESADHTRQKRKEANTLTEQFLQSSFLHFFGEPVRNEKGWEAKKIGEVFQVETGSAPSREIKDFFEGEIPWIKTGEIVGRVIYDSEEKISEAAIKSSNCKIFPTDTIVIAMYGQGQTRGRVGILGIPASTNQACAAILPSIQIETLFAFWYLKLSYKQLRELGRGGNQPNLNLSLVKNFPFYLPPLFLQQQFASIVADTESLRQKQQESEKELEHLFQALLQQYFGADAKPVIKAVPEALPIAAEPTALYQKQPLVVAIPEAKQPFAKRVLGGKIVSLFKDDPHFTHIKFQKLQFLAEHVMGANLRWNYYFQSAGPYDPAFMHTVADKLKESGWYEERNFKYYPLGKEAKIEDYYNGYFGPATERLHHLFFLLAHTTEAETEIIATMYAVWNNRIIKQQPVSKELLLEDFYNWSERKKDYTPVQIEEGWQWLQTNGFTPTGFGNEIKRAKEKR